MLTTKTKIGIARSLSSLIRAARKLVGRSQFAEVRRYGLKWRLDLAEGIDLAIYLNCYERDTFAYYRRRVGKGAVVLDVGANIGVHALFLARLVGSRGHVYAIEPTDFAFGKLQANLALNLELCSRVTCRQAMLLESQNSVVPGAVVSSWPLVGPDRPETALGGDERSTAGAGSETLDGIVEEWGLQDIQLIKLDVDGYELDVLKGGVNTLTTRAPEIVMELCPHLYASHTDSFGDLIRFVDDLNYEMFDMTTRRRIPAAPSDIEASIPWGAGKNVLLRKP